MRRALVSFLACLNVMPLFAQSAANKRIDLPTSKVLLHPLENASPTNGLPVTIVLSPVLVMGLVGGVPPAVRAARQRIAVALREL